MTKNMSVHARLILLGLILCVSAAPVQAQIAFRGAASATAAGVTPTFRAAASATTTGSTLTITRPTGVVANDVLIAAIGVSPSSAVITPPAGWTLVRRSDNAGPTSNSLAVYYRVALGGEPSSYAWGVSGANFTVGGIQAFFNVDAANPIDIENGQATPFSSAHATPSVTTTVANAMVVTSHTFASARTWSPPSGMTESYDRASSTTSNTGQSIEGSRVLQPVAGATGIKTANTAGSADAGNAHILALRPANANLTIATPAGTVANDVMIAAIGFNNSGAAITAPAGWTLVRQINNASTTSNSLALYRRTAAAGEPASHTWAIAGGAFLVGGIQGFSGVDPANPIDVENGQTTASALAHATPSVVTTIANTLVVTSHTFSSAATWTPPAGMTESFDRSSGAASTTGQSIEGSRVLQPAAGATGVKTATAASNADVGNTHILALRPVNVAPTVSLTSPANGATFTAPATITLTATAGDTDGTIQKVEFFHGGTNLIATATAAPYTFNWTNVAAGSYTLTAKATDNLNATTTSAPVNVTVNTGVAQLFFIHTDHLNSPRLITNGTGQVVWRWEQSDPFGGNQPDENPSGLGTFTCNLRLPGQYFDKETNLHYNYFRDYDPGIGRYLQTDLVGATLSPQLYSYVYGNPISSIDPLGLAKPSPQAQIEAAIARNDPKTLQQLIESGGLSPQQEATAQAGLRALEILGRTSGNTKELARQLGRSNKEVRRAIEQCKQENLPRGGPTRNPDVRVDPTTGEVYPLTPRGGVGDPIGNIFDYLK